MTEDTCNGNSDCMWSETFCSNNPCAADDISDLCGCLSAGDCNWDDGNCVVGAPTYDDDCSVECVDGAPMSLDLCNAIEGCRYVDDVCEVDTCKHDIITDLCSC